MVDKIKVIEALCDLASTGDEVDRCHVVKTLGVFGDVQAIPTLIECLRDTDIDVSIDAAEALGRIGNPTAIPTLLDSLMYDPNGDVKTAIVEALAQIGGQEAIASLLEIAKKCPDEMVWDETDDWDTWWDMQLKAVAALGELRVTEAIPVLTVLLDDEEGQDIESEILKALALIGGEGVNVLSQRLNEGSPRERRRAATALGFSQSAEARKALARAMTDKDRDVRVAVIKALGKLDASQYMDIILRFLKDTDAEVRHTVIEVTMNFSITQDNVGVILEKFAPLLTDSSDKVRVAILTAMRHIKNIPQKILLKIRQRLTDQNDTVISAACILLAHLGDKTVLIKLLQILSDQGRSVTLRSQVATALGIFGDTEAVSILSWAVKDKAQSVRLAALNALMQLDKQQKYHNLEHKTKAQDNKQYPRTPLEVIIDALKNKAKPDKVTTPSNKIQPNEIQSVSDKEHSLADSLTINNHQTTENGDTPLGENRAAMSTLDAIVMDNEEISLSINKMAKNETTKSPQNSEDFSEEIQEYMTIAQENIELGERLFVSPKMDVATDVRHLSARILGDSDREAAVMALIETLNDNDPILCREAIKSLGVIAHRSPKIVGLTNAFEYLITLIKIDNCEIRLACARTLAVLGNKSAIPVLFNSLQDEDASVRTQIIQSLVTLILTDSEQNETKIPLENEVNTETILAQFIKLLHDINMGVRKAAADALAALQYTDALDSIIEATVDVGTVARDMGKALRILDIEQSGTQLLKKLENVPDSYHRRFVIEMLEEVFV
ncbi:HEAT repeat domain-containing protein [Candidatus Parabeggiatoa sp. HSG14]|uniref:HEAT repeat domain-containing protein n=1 Tax=Candidatus Parabeggiatoa sp. HSG14 TaxID=3055593 RepID=UPI0025A738D7|nr:HEAT repeat domain-containing protein [Thiotrichales bacterium HSG14]